MIDPNEKNPLRDLNKRRLAELALMYAVPIITRIIDKKDCGHSRLVGLQLKLQDTVGPLLAKSQNASNATLAEVIDKLKTWGDNSGWLVHTQHNAALISFCLVIIEDSPVNYEPKILKILNDISEHLEKGNKLMTKAMVGGQEAADNWAELYAK